MEESHPFPAASGGPESSDPGLPLPLIPKLMHWVWMGSELPEQHEKWLKRWSELHPGWQFCAWNEHNIRSELPPLFLKLFDEAEDIVRKGPWQLRSDLARYALLWKYGGVYVDTDTEPLRNIEDLCLADCWFGWERDDIWVGNAYIGVVKHHPFIARLMSGIQDNVKVWRGRARANVLTGPQYVTERLKGYRGPQVAVYAQKFLYPYGFNELQRGHETFEEAYAVHHWNNQRKEQKVPF